jgi:polyisoprenoid-binding protein YceI
MELKLKAVSSSCKLGLAGVLFLALALTGCPTRPPPAPSAVPAAAAPQPIAPHRGRPYDIVAAESLLIVRVYRAGALAAAGHNHIIASHTLAGTIYLPDDRLGSSFEVRIAADALTVDEPELRAAEASADFPADVSDSARAGTRRNMLSSAVLDAADYPEIVLRAVRLEPAHDAAAALLTAHLDAEVRGQHHPLAVTARYALAGDTLTVSADAALTQSELGLTPFTALMGALAVQDEMRVSLRLVARAAAYSSP